jgi:hypothetical protein
MELLLFITLSVTVPKDGPFHFGVRRQSCRSFFWGLFRPYSLPKTKKTPFRINHLRIALSVSPFF